MAVAAAAFAYAGGGSLSGAAHGSPATSAAVPPKSEQTPVAAPYEDSAAGALDRELPRFLGETRNDYSANQGPVSDQIIERISLPDEPVRLRDGNWLMPGCQPHNCDAKAVVLVDPRGGVLAAAMLGAAGNEVWVYVPDAPEASGDVHDIGQWSAATPHRRTKITRLPKAPG
ncbi:hypothetical protein G3573_08230 [Caulobacter sp. 17J65-9]|nr:hypothetical protein [Caulobacter sp. 17J65-9]